MIAESLTRGKEIAVAGFGRFVRADRSARALPPMDHSRLASPSGARLKLKRAEARDVGGICSAEAGIQTTIKGHTWTTGTRCAH